MESNNECMLIDDSNLPASNVSDSAPGLEEKHLDRDRDAMQRWWKTGLLICSSALVGAGAVALWNRHALMKMQRQLPMPDVSVGQEGVLDHKRKEYF